MIMSNNVRTIDWLQTESTMKYDQLKISRGTTHNYLGMVFDILQPPLIVINQQGMIEDIISSTRTNVISATNTDSNIKSHPRHQLLLTYSISTWTLTYYQNL